MKFTRVAIDNYRFTIIQYAAFLILGLGAISTMPYSEDPPLDPAGTTIIVYYPGTSPIDLERQIVEPLEEAVNEIEDIKHIATRMEDGTTKISVEFESYVDSDEKYREVREQVNKVRDRLPPHIAALNVIQWSTSNTRIMQLALISENASYHELYDEAQHIKRNLERVSNVKQVEILGDPDEIVEINIDLERLGHYGLGISHVTHAIHTQHRHTRWRNFCGHTTVYHQNIGFVYRPQRHSSHRLTNKRRHCSLPLRRGHRRIWISRTPL